MKTLLERITQAQEDMVDDWPVYDSDRSLVRNDWLTASENIRCLRQLYFEKNRAPVDFRWGYAQRGHAVEAWVVDRIEASLKGKERLQFHGYAQRSFIGTKARLSGTPDGLITGDGTPYLLEIKSVDPRTNMEAMTAPKPQHFAQVQQNMYLLRHNIRELRLCNPDLIKAKIIYVDASNFERMVEFEVIYDPAAVDGYIARASRLFGAAAPEELPAEGLTSQEGCTYCAFKEDCSQIEVERGGKKKRNTPKSPKKFAPRGVVGTLRKYHTKKSAAETVAKELKELGAELKAYADENDLTAIESSTYVAELQTVAGRKTLDIDAYAEATDTPPDDFYKVGKPSVRLTVTKRET